MPSTTRRLLSRLRSPLRPPARRPDRPPGTSNEGAAGGKRREFVVVGLGRFGTSVARTLVEHGHDVLAIDGEPDRVQQVSTELPHVVQLDATNAEALRQIGIGEFDTGLVCIGMDFESNILATVLLLRAGVPRVITKARTRTQKRILQAVGAHDVILPEQEAGDHLGRRLANRNFIDYLPVGGEISVVEIHAPRDLYGKTMEQCDLRRRTGLTAIAIQRGRDVVVNPGPDVTIQEDDVLVVIGRLEDAERLQA